MTLLLFQVDAIASRSVICQLLGINEVMLATPRDQIRTFPSAIGPKTREARAPLLRRPGRGSSRNRVEPQRTRELRVVGISCGYSGRSRPIEGRGICTSRASNVPLLQCDPRKRRRRDLGHSPLGQTSKTEVASWRIQTGHLNLYPHPATVSIKSDCFPSFFRKLLITASTTLLPTSYLWPHTSRIKASRATALPSRSRR